MSFVRRIPLWFWWAVVVWLVCLPWPGMTAHADRDVQLVPFASSADRPRDVVANLLLFVPFGYLFVAAHPRRGYAVLLAVAAAVSLVAEALQLFSATRFPSATDLLTNSAGALAGGWCGRRARRTVPKN